MDKDAILGILGTGGSELELLKENLEQLTGFLSVVEAIDKLPEMDRRVAEDGLSLYHAISKENEIAILENTISTFFGEPVKRSGDPLPSHLEDNLTVNYLGGVKPDQTLFLKKIGQNELYAALFPWQRKVNVNTVHLGLYNPIMPDSDYERLNQLVTESITQRVSEELDGSVTGQVQGISLPSFLQMSEMEGSTCSLRIRSDDKVGMLHLLNGELIDAETGEKKDREAAQTIIAWDNPSIEIRKAVGRTQNKIQIPLMHLLMSSLQKKDEEAYEKDAPPKKEPAKSPPKKEPSMVSPDKKAEEIEPAAEPPDELPPEPEIETAKEDAVIDDALVEKEPPKPLKRKKVDKSAIDLKPKKKFPTALVAGLAVVIVCVVGFFIFEGMLNGSGGSDYQQLMRQVDRLKDVDAQEKLLMDFINNREPDDETTQAELKLQELWQQNEEVNYQKAMDRVNNLPMDASFEENAKTIYASFLEKYPNTQHRNEIEQALSEITGLSEDIIYSELKNLSEKDYVQKIQSLEKYLSNYSDGKYIDSVKKMITETLGRSYQDFKREIGVCERNGTWDACLKICDDYLGAFSNYLDTSEIQSIRSRIQANKDYADLEEEVKGVDDNTARSLYLAYLDANPDTPNRDAIEKALANMNKKAAAGRHWESLKKDIQGSGTSLKRKIDKLETYISNNHNSPYITEAREILKNLEKEAAKQLSQRKEQRKSKAAEEQAKKEAEARYAELLKKQEESARIENEKSITRTALENTGGRYTSEGDSAVIDQRTKLMWSLLDSQREIGTCMDHRTAIRYVQGLQHNGHSDWRLPTSAELASIYKNKPYFPASGADWYWTSEKFAKGYSYIANTISAKQESAFKKVPRDVEQCGAVRAVRP